MKFIISVGGGHLIIRPGRLKS